MARLPKHAVACMGQVWSLSHTAYRRFLRDAAAGREWNLDSYGKVVGELVKVTDLSAEDAKEMLREMKGAK